MAPRKSKSATAKTESAGFATKVEKKRSSKHSHSTSAHADAHLSANSNRVKRYRNGILNLERTPAYLVQTVRKNFIESPLLSLPPEIRNRIWSLAMGGQLVDLPTSLDPKGHALQFKLKTGKAIVYAAVPPRSSQFAFDVTKVPAAFHLPEVCRQIYAETALTAYQQNTFLFEHHHTTWKNSMARLMISQRRAITSVQINPGYLNQHMNDKPLKASGLITHKLPSLKKILVTKDAMRYIRWRRARLAMMGSHDDAGWRELIAKSLKKHYGDGVKFLFED